MQSGDVKNVAHPQLVSRCVHWTLLSIPMGSLQGIFCHNISDRNQKMESLLHFRKTSYGNGESLSQGTLYHKHHSGVVSLEALTKDGLFQLYPELNDAHGREKWTNQVRELRSLYATPRATTSQDVRKALRMARPCFRRSQSFDIALLLLKFKNRIARTTSTKGQLHWASSYFWLKGFHKAF